VRLFADVLSVPAQRVAIVVGHTSPSKIVEINGLTLATVNAALARASAGAP
jgi:uncharacterized protein YggU (UPF0235/DUF167 family)